jgi:hypothetical protein
MFTLKIKTANAAFDPYPEMEVARILREVANRLENGTDAGTISEMNGNRCGSFYLTGGKATRY